MGDWHSKECRAPDHAPYPPVDNKTRENCLGHGPDFRGVPSTSKSEIQELRTILPDGRARYIFFAWIDGKWVDLAPYGNRLPSRRP